MYPRCTSQAASIASPAHILCELVLHVAWSGLPASFVSPTSRVTESRAPEFHQRRRREPCAESFIQRHPSRHPTPTRAETFSHHQVLRTSYKLISTAKECPTTLLFVIRTCWPRPDTAQTSAPGAALNRRSHWPRAAFVSICRPFHIVAAA